MCCSPQTDVKAPLLEEQPHSSLIMGKLSLCAPTTCTPTFYFGAGGYPVHYQKRNINSNPATKSSVYNGVLPTRSDSAMVAQSLWEVPNQYLILFKAQLYETESVPNTACVITKRRLDSSGSWGKTKYYGSTKGMEQ